nr:hypothetical protein [Tanacetum cinerariifolium]
MFESRQTTIPFPSHLNDYYYDEKMGSYGLQCLDAYSYGATRVDDSLPRKEKDPRSFTLPCYINNVCFENALPDLGASKQKTRKVCGQFCDQGFKGDACKKLGDKVGASWRILITCSWSDDPLVTSLTHDSANSCVMQGASCTQRKVSIVLFVFPFVLMLLVIVITVVIVMVILVVVVVAIVRVAVVVVSSSVSSINKLSLVIVGSFSCYWSSTCPGVPISIVSICHFSSLCFQSSSNAISNQLSDGNLSHN